MSRSVPRDTRGIIDPATMLRHAEFARYPAGDDLDGLVDWFWSVRWDLPDSAVHRQYVLNHPSGHISIGTVDDSGPLPTPRGRVYGLITRLSERVLTGSGWTVAAKTSTGGFGVLLGSSAAAITDRQVGLDALAGLDGDAVTAAVTAAEDQAARVDALREALSGVVRRRPAEQVEQARRIAEVARIAETDRSVRQVEELARAAGVSVRTLQRLFLEHVGIGPAWVIRRWRIIEAVERVHADGLRRWADWPGWADLAVELGYSDQAHLVRDVRAHLGQTPERYRRRIAAGVAG